MATDAQILSEAKASLLRILQTDTTAWSEGERRQQQLAIRELQELIDRYEKKTSASGGRRLHHPVSRVNI